MPLEVTLAPLDAHNQDLLENVRPPAWKHPEPAPLYDIVVVGAGTAGLVTAAGASILGARVALVEGSLMGGDCLNFGCVPSKALLRSARAVADAVRAPRLGARVEGSVGADFPAVMERMRRARAGLSRHDSARRFRDLGVDVFLGEGRFVSPDTAEVDGRRLRFKRAVVATGSRPLLPPIEGLDSSAVLTNETVFSLTHLPERFLVVGGGPLGCELAQAFARLGSRVTMVERMDRFLHREDPEAAEILAEVLRRDGVDLKLRTRLERVSAAGDVKLAHLSRDGRDETLEVSAILIAIGRAPNVEGIGLEAAGVDYDPKTGVRVDGRLRTTNRRIYAAGDVCLPWRFTHAADAAARLVLRNVLFFGRKKTSTLVVPWCTYTDPEVARVGMGEREAREQGVPVSTYRIPLSEVDRAVLDGEAEGFVKVLVERGRDRILGATIVASHAGEMIGEITLAMTAGLGLRALSSVIHPYPTQAEAIRKAADASNRERLTPFVKKLLRWRLAWMS